MFSLRGLLVSGLILATIPFIFWRPYIGILAWSWIGFMNPHRLTWGFVYTAPVAMIIGLATILSFVISREPKRFPTTFLSSLLIVYMLWMCVSTVFAIDHELAYPKWDKAMKVMIGVLLTLVIMYTRERLELLISVIVGSIGFYSIKGGIFTITSGGQWMVFGPPNSFFESNNALALATIMVIPLMRYLHLQAKRLWLRLGLFAAIALSIISVVGSYSRGAFLALSAMLFVLILKSPRRGILLCATLIGALLALAIVPDKWYDRMHSITTYETDGSAIGRFQAWKFAYEIAKENPITGGGFFVGSNTPLFLKHVPEAETSRAAHSIWFEVLGEHGFVGLAIYVLIGATALLTGSWIISRTKSRPELTWASNLAAMLQVSMVGYAVGGSFLSQALFDLYWVLVVLMIQTSIIVTKELAAERAMRQETYHKVIKRPRRIQPGTVRSPCRPKSTHPVKLNPRLSIHRQQIPRIDRPTTRGRRPRPYGQPKK